MLKESVLFMGVAGALALGVVYAWQIHRAARLNPAPRTSAMRIEPSPNFQDTEVSLASRSFPAQNTRIAFVRQDTVHLYQSWMTSVLRIAEGYDPEISPDGEAILFTSNLDEARPETTIKVFRLETRNVTEFSSLAGLNVRQATWSHDGKRIAFTVFVDGKWHIGIMDFATGKWYDVTKDLAVNQSGGMYSPTLAPDGGSILLHDLQTIYEIALDGEVVNRIPMRDVVPPTELATSARFQFSRNKKSVLFNGARNPDSTAIYLYNFDDRKYQRLTPTTMDWVANSAFARS